MVEDMAGSKPMAGTKHLIAEFVGTFMLVFAVGCNVITGTAAWAVTSIACTLMVSIYAFNGVSNQFNPAVTFALALLKDQTTMTWKDAVKLMAVQLIAGLVAGFAYAGMFWDVFNLSPATGYGGLHAGAAEFFYTFLLVFCVLNCAVSKKNGPDSGTEFYGMAIGFSVIAGGYGAGHISGGCFNPAVAFGIDASSAGVGFGWCVVYTLFELLGAAAAVGIYKAVRPDEYGGQIKQSSRLLSEFIGTFFLVLTVGLNVIGGSKAPVWSISASLMCVIFCLGSCSGGHFNPAVTMALTVAKRFGNDDSTFQSKDTFFYMLSQIVGGIVGALTYSLMEKGVVFPLQPGAGHTWLSAYLAEFVFTFMLCYVVLSVACVEDAPCKDSFFGFAIASCVTAGGYAVGAISGGCLNPAVSIGIALSSIGRGHGIFHVFPYVIFQLLAGVAAAAVFNITHKSKINK